MLTIQALGDFHITCDDKDLTSQLDATRILLLTYLAESERPQSRAQLAELLWPDRAPGRARSNLRTLFTRLRPLLGDYLMVDTDRIALQRVTAFHFDVAHFTTHVETAQRLPTTDPVRKQHYRDAILLYRGDFLAAIDSDGREVLENWLVSRRLQFRGQIVQILRHFADDPATPITERLECVRRLTHFEPLDETVCATLMRLLALNQQREEALWHFQRYQRELADVWRGATPSEELMMLAAKIRLGMDIGGISLAQPHRGAVVLHGADRQEHQHPGQTAAREGETVAPPAAGTAPTTQQGQQEAAGIALPPLVLPPFPIPLKPLVGRAQEREQLRQWLNLGYRLISVSGMGGVGKSHFVQAVIGEELSRWHSGALYVNLPDVSPFTEPSARTAPAVTYQHKAMLILCHAIATALEIPLPAGQDPTDKITQMLIPHACCLLLDNFEHLLHATPYLQTLLAKAPQLTIIAITRSRLSIADEANITLRGLPCLPCTNEADKNGPTPAVGTAEMLLYLTLKRNRPDRQLSNEDYLFIHDICRAVHGLPLAIEMAPTLLQQMTLREAAARLAEEPLVLTAGNGGLAEQQHSLYAFMDTMFAAVTPAGQEALVSLTVFAAPFDQEAAGAVINRKQWIELHDQGWLEATDARHFALHPLVAAFARSLCTEQRWATVAARARQAHATYYAKLVAEQPIFQNAFYAKELHWLRQLFPEITNACQVLLAENGVEAVPLLHTITMYGHHFGEPQTVQYWLQRGLEALPATLPARFRLLLDYISCTTELRDIAAAKAALREAHALADDQADQAALLTLYERLGWAAHLDYAATGPHRRQEGWHYFTEALVLAETLGHRQQTVNMLAQRAFLAAWDPEAYQQAQADLQRAVALALQLGQQGLLGSVYKTFAYVEFAANHLPLAQRYSERAIQLLSAETDVTMTLGWLYMERSQIALAQQDLTTARHYLARAMQLFQPAAYEAGLTQCNTLLGIVALLEDDLATAERHWLRAYRAVYHMSQQDKLVVSLMLAIGLTQVIHGDPLLGAQLAAMARTQYVEKSFHWVPPEQQLMAYLLKRVEHELDLLALPQVSIDGQIAVQALHLLAAI